MFFDFLIYQKFKGGTLIKCLISMLSNLAETLHSSAKWKNKQVAKIWGLYLKKQRFGDTMQFPEGLLHVQEYFPNLLETALCH